MKASSLWMVGQTNKLPSAPERLRLRLRCDGKRAPVCGSPKWRINTVVRLTELVEKGRKGNKWDGEVGDVDDEMKME